MNPLDVQDEFIEDLMKNIPESWGSSEGSAESIISEYLHALEERLRRHVDCDCVFERHYDPGMHDGDCDEG